MITMLPVRHLPATLPFYQQLGFRVEHRRDDWGWAMLELDGCRLMLDQSLHAAGGAGGGPRMGVIYLYPDDLAAFCAAARGRGLPVPEIEGTFYGHREVRIEDPDGNRLWIGQAEAA